MGDVCLKGRSALGEPVKRVAKVLNRQGLGLGLGCKGEELSVGRKLDKGLTESWGTE